MKTYHEYAHINRKDKQNNDMSQQPIKFQYQKGIVSGGYSFSAYHNTITLSEYVENLKNAKIREAIQYEAKTARTFYIEEVTNLKAKGEKINSFLVKRDAIRKAKDKSQAKYAEIWSDVEDIYKNPNETDNLKIIPLNNMEFAIIVSGSDNFFHSLMKAIETCEKDSRNISKAVDSP